MIVVDEFMLLLRIGAAFLAHSCLVGTGLWQFELLDDWVVEITQRHESLQI